MGFELISLSCPARFPVNISTTSSRTLNGSLENANFNAAEKFMLNLRGMFTLMLFCPYKGLCQKRKTVVAGRHTVGSDKVSLVTGLLILRISAGSDVTFLAGH